MLFYSIPTSSDKLRLVVAALLTVPLTIAGWVLTPLTVNDEIAPNTTEVGLGGSCRGGPLLVWRLEVLVLLVVAVLAVTVELTVVDIPAFIPTTMSPEALLGP